MVNQMDKLLPLLALLAVMVGSSAAEDLRSWTPRDSIEMRYFVATQANPSQWPSPGMEGEVTFSAQGDHFFVVSHKGDVDADSVIFQLDVYSTSSVRGSLNRRETHAPPISSVRVQSFTNYPGIQFAEWAMDGHSIYFQAPSIEQVIQVYKYDILTGALIQLTHAETDIVNFAQGGGTLLYGIRTVAEEAIPYPAGFVAYHGPHNSSAEPKRMANLLHQYKTYVLDTDGVERQTPFDFSWFGIDQVKISPNGRFAVAIVNYTAHMFDLRDLTQQALANVPNTGAAALLYWSSNSEIAFIYGDEQGASFRRHRGEWIYNRRESNPTIQIPRGPLVVSFEQNTNTPPVLIAQENGNAITLSKPDPVLQGIARALWEPFSWVEPNGDRITGSLMLPPNRSGGGRLPLIIQAYHNYTGVFLPDGPFPGTAYAAQSLAARGFAVLQIEGVTEVNANSTLREGPAFVEKIEAAVAALHEAGIVDRDRVGLSGFSRGGYWAYYAITHPNKLKLAAAIANDSTTQSFSELLFEGMSGAFRSRGSFWIDRQAWLEHDPSFNVERSQTPILFTGNNANMGLAADEYGAIPRSTISAFQLTRRPMEYMFFPNGEHTLVRPREQLALMNAVVDWFVFWILDEEDQDPAKAEQYARWRRIQESWRSQQAWEAEGNPAGSWRRPVLSTN